MISQDPTIKTSWNFGGLIEEKNVCVCIDCMHMVSQSQSYVWWTLIEWLFDPTLWRQRSISHYGWSHDLEASNVPESLHTLYESSINLWAYFSYLCINHVRDIGLLQKRVMRYLKGTQDYGLKYTKVDDFCLIAHSNSYFNGDKENIESTSGYLMTLGSTMVSCTRLHSMNLPHFTCTRGILNHCAIRIKPCEEFQIFPQWGRAFYSNWIPFSPSPIDSCIMTIWG